MSPQPPGWYQDPSSPDQLRYWDGVSWSNHTTPKKSPTASQSQGGLAQAARPGQTGPPVPTTPMPQGSGWQGQPGGGQVPQAAPQFGQPQSGWTTGVPTTADGVPLASWGRRLAAWLIDGVILLVLSFVAIRVFVPGYFDGVQALVDAASAQDETAMNNLMPQVTGEASKAALLWLVLSAAYCVGFWTTTAQTPGKMAVGISVRRADRPGPLDLATAVRRRLLTLIQVIPLVGGIYTIVWGLDGLWPLWDSKRQTLHDKIARTQVVVGKQKRSTSGS